MRDCAGCAGAFSVFWASSDATASTITIIMMAAATHTDVQAHVQEELDDVVGHTQYIGASQMIIDRKIKLKSDGPILRFTQTGLLFEDGSTLDADVVVFTTGFVLLTDQ
ncbi:hypothetical protein BDR06DRAFT_974797 [Suillus hirtellus]|nr:hypothetical protein BDR06DRAFT_974797 [Suillus hirtellus]